MDQETLVKAAHQLIEELEKRGVQVRAAMWVELPDIRSWRLWIVSTKGKDSAYRREFYGLVGAALAPVQAHFPGITISDVELKFDTDPNVQALGMMMHMPGLGNVHMSRNMVNGVYTPDGIVLRMAL